MKVLSLYNGISCGRIALERANIPVERYVSFEIDKYANQVAQANYPNDEYFGDVITADFTQFYGFDMVIGGSPCTHWSIAKQGRETTSSGIGWELFMHFVRAIREVKPRYFLYENNYSIHDDIKLAIEKELGVKLITIDSALVSPQKRKRIYVVGRLNENGQYEAVKIEQPEDKNINIVDILDEQAKRKYYPMPNARATKNYVQFDVSGKGYNSQQDRAFYINGKFGTFPSARANTKRKVCNFQHDTQCFDLTLDECKALQTIPKSYIMPLHQDKENKALIAIGNGWTVDVIAHILKSLEA
jgi:DNA (cytosine-5)-methyltransferase 3A